MNITILITAFLKCRVFCLVNWHFFLELPTTYSELGRIYWLSRLAVINVASVVIS